ncbi:hypothetical protein [Nitratidesulfovibrio sp. 1201_IL3209]|uniref:hypothetical protein n=1 Tax=Nitratidesulfovibrio sp. 1201_IL3209 TaxID=3084053 RepID=UPI002FD9B5A9
MTMPTHTPRRAAGCPQPSGHPPRPAAPGRMRTHGVCPRCGGTIGRGHPSGWPRQADQAVQPPASGPGGLGTLLRRGLAAPVRYLRAAPLPHATGGVSALIGAGLARVALEALAEEALSLGLLLFMPASGWFGLALLCGADGMSRYREYLRVRRMLDRWGYTPRLLRPLASSRCQRDAAMQAARETGYADRARAYYRALGYRWYHLLPDKVTANPLTFLDIRFLRATFLPGKR